MLEKLILAVILLSCLIWIFRYFHRILKKPEEKGKQLCCSSCSEDCADKIHPEQ
jgi:hypothetical protein